MVCAGVLLTGGASRRMGSDKATLPHPSGAATLAERTAALLAEVTDPAVELGPGHSTLPAHGDCGGGPLAALGSAVDVWASLPAGATVVVVATDLPRLTAGLLGWLARHPASGAVVPVDGGRLQPLCARYTVTDLVACAPMAAAGERRLTAWLDRLAVHAAPPEEWLPFAGDALALRDADTPAAMAVLGAGWGRR